MGGGIGRSHGDIRPEEQTTVAAVRRECLGNDAAPARNLRPGRAALLNVGVVGFHYFGIRVFTCKLHRWPICLSSPSEKSSYVACSSGGEVQRRWQRKAQRASQPRIHMARVNNPRGAVPSSPRDQRRVFHGQARCNRTRRTAGMPWPEQANAPCQLVIGLKAPCMGADKRGRQKRISLTSYMYYCLFLPELSPRWLCLKRTQDGFNREVRNKIFNVARSEETVVRVST